MTFNVIVFDECTPAILLHSTVLYSPLLQNFPSIYLCTHIHPTHFHSLLPTPTYSCDMILVDQKSKIAHPTFTSLQDKH